MTRATLLQKPVAAAVISMACAAGADVGGLEFHDSAACRVNEIPLGAPARVEASRAGARVEVRVGANFGCQTTAGGARLEKGPEELRLFADTVLPVHPTPACKCTRHLTYRFTLDESGARRIVFVKDGRVEGEGRLDPQ
jgi:hypothetical protein